VQIISCDQYFILGVQSLIKELNFSETSRKVIFDAGCHCVYILNHDKLRREVKDSFSALVHFSRFILPRNSTLEAYSEHLNENCKKDLLNVNVIPITIREIMVIKGLCRVPNPRDIARELNISEKTVSGHKINGLRKLGVKNTITLHFVLQSWQEILPVISSLKTMPV